VPLIEVVGHLDLTPIEAKAPRHLDAAVAGGGLDRYPRGRFLFKRGPRAKC
jgi:hypothetical protein